MELSELRKKDGIYEDFDDDSKEGEICNGNKEIREEDDFVIPAVIHYYLPQKIRRKKIKSLNDACNNVEDILRQH